MLSDTNFVPFFAGVGVAFAAQFIWKIKRLPSNIFRASKALTTHDKVKMVLIVRTDLKMGTGKIAAQCAHAAVNCYDCSLMTCPEISTKWKLLGQPKIVLKVNESGDQCLQHLNKKALEIGIISCLIKDAGRTQVEAGCITVLGIGPGYSEQIDAVTQHLKLL